MTTDSQSKNTIVDLTPGKPGQPRIYTEEEMKKGAGWEILQIEQREVQF